MPPSCTATAPLPSSTALWPPPPHSKLTSKVPRWTGGGTVTQTAQHSCHVFLISFKFFFSSSPSSFLFLFYDMEHLLVRSPPHDFRLWLNTSIENSTETTWALGITLHQRHPPQVCPILGIRVDCVLRVVPSNFSLTTKQTKRSTLNKPTFSLSC